MHNVTIMMSRMIHDKVDNVINDDSKDDDIKVWKMKKWMDVGSAWQQ